MLRVTARARDFLVFGSFCWLLGASCESEPLEANLPVSGDSIAGRSVADPMAVRPVDRLTAKIDVEDRVVLSGNRHPLARAELDVGATPASHHMERMMLVLRPDDVQEQALQALVHAQHDPSSSAHHAWLTPEMYAERFGISANDVATVTTWLQGHGMTIDDVSSGGRMLQFTGNAAQVEKAFHTSMRAFMVNGELHHANASEPEIPRALAGVVSGVVSLHDFRSSPSNVRRDESNSGNTWYYGGTIQQSALVPQDLVKIYNVGPLYTASLDGTGQSIAVIGRSNIDVGNVRTFRSSYGLPANDPQIILNGKDPGIICGGDEAEAYLDVEWAGALAKKATVKFVVAASTLASDGIYLASQYAVSHNVAPIVSLSYGLCEKSIGTAGNQMLNSLWQQAAAQGMSVFVASMDSGAAGCDQMNAAVATGGLGVNGLGSTPFNTAVGGTQFDDVSNRSTYWSATNDPTTQASALGYIPELVWNESASGLFSSGGGVSTIYSKPSWQFGLGVLPDGKRDIPDVAMPAAIQDAYKIYGDNQVMGVGGTSAATPVFASIMALVLQKIGQAQGLVNPILYALAYNQNYSGGAAVFHDIVKGTNTVPGVTGYNAGPGYDMATGLGSVDVTQLVNHWSEGNTLPSFQVAGATTTASAVPGASATAAFTVKTNNGFNSAISFSVTGLPAGVTGSFAPTSLTGSGSTTLTLVVASSATPGTYALTITGTAGSVSHSAPLSLTVNNPLPPLSLSFAPNTLDVPAGGSGTMTVTTIRGTTFSSAVSLTISGLPTGVTAQFSPATITAPGAGSSVLTGTVAATVAGGTYAATLTATGGGVTKTALIAINVLPAPSFSLTLSPTSLSLSPGAAGTTWATTIRTTTFNSAIAVKVTGAPAGVTTTTGSIAIPGSGVCALGVTVGSTVTAGTYPLTVSATGGGVTKTAPLSLIVLAPPSFSLTVSPASLSLAPGASGNSTATTVATSSFNSAITVSVTGAPAGVTVTAGAVSAPGSGSKSIGVTLASSVVAGTYPLTVSATGGGVTKTASLSLTVLPPPSFSLTVSPASLSLAPGASGSSTATTTGTNNFNAAVTVSVTGAPAGVTVTAGAVSAPGSGSKSIGVTVGSAAAAGTYPLTVSATGGGVTKTASLSLTVLPPPSFSLTLNPASLSVAPGASGSSAATIAGVNNFSAAVTVSVTGAPTGVTATAGVVNAPGSGSKSISVTVGSSVAGGSYPLTVTATGGGVTKTATLTLLVPAMTVSPSVTTALSLSRGSTVSVNLTTAMLGGFSSAVTFAVQGQPSGVTATFAPASLPAPGSGSTTLKLSATSSAATGPATLTVKATAGSVVRTFNLSLTVK